MTLTLSFACCCAASVGMLWNPPGRKTAGSDPALALETTGQRWAEAGVQRFFDYGPRPYLSSAYPLRKRYGSRYVSSFHPVRLPVIGAFDLIHRPADPLPSSASGPDFRGIRTDGRPWLIGCRRSAEGPALPAMNPFSIPWHGLSGATGS